MKWSRLYWGHRFLQTMHALYISSLWFRLVAGCCRIAVYFSNAEIENFPFLCRNATDYWKLQQICSKVWTSINQNTRVPFDQNNVATSNHGAPCSNTWTAYHTNTHSPFCQNSSLATSPCLAIWSTFQMAWILPKMIVPRDFDSFYSTKGVSNRVDLSRTFLLVSSDFDSVIVRIKGQSHWLQRQLFWICLNKTFLCDTKRGY